MSKFLNMSYFFAFILTLSCLFLEKSLSQDSLIIFKYPSEKDLTVEVKANVTRVHDTLRFQYEVGNLNFSLQRLWRFSIRPRAAIQAVHAPNGWDVRIISKPFVRISWGSSDSTKDIPPSGALSGFSYASNGIPAISDYYATGWVEPPTVNVEPDSIAGGIFPENSLHGRTLAPLDPPMPLITASFLDTLLSNVHQSFALGWIKDQRTEQRLDRKLERAKRLLQMADTWPPGSSAFLDETEKALKEEDNECSREYGQDAVREVPRLMLDEEKLRDLIRIGRESMQGSGKDKMKKPDENRRKEQYRDALYWAAKQVMESFVREVEILNKLSEKGLPAAAGKRQYLTSEAYALLKYNAEYLIDQLPEKKKK
jgi:hypothetical protein